MSGFCGLRDYLLYTNGTGKQDMVHHNRLIKNRAPTENAIVVKGLIKSFKRLKVLDGINFAVKHGTILALLGPNGAGKTTTVHILGTLLLPDGGKALINGLDVVKEAAGCGV